MTRKGIQLETKMQQSYNFAAMFPNKGKILVLMTKSKNLKSKLMSHGICLNNICTKSSSWEIAEYKLATKFSAATTSSKVGESRMCSMTHTI
jgi:hypothetical protein